MKAYKVRIKYAMCYDSVIEEIEVHKMTEKSYLDERGTSRRHTDYQSVYATKSEAIDHARRMTQADIDRLEADLQKLRAKLLYINAMEAE